jgi:hypothetical protein
MTNPVLLRVLMVTAAVACFAAAHFLPAQAPVLIPAGAGLLGWAKAAPGHDGTSGGGGGAGAAVGLVFALMLMQLPLGCSAFGKTSEADHAQAVIAAFRFARKACVEYEGTGGQHSEAADLLCLGLTVSDNAGRTTVEPPPDAGE